MLEAPSGPISVAEGGEGVTVVAVHGAPGSASDFQRLAQAARGDLRMVAVDLPGFGRTAEGDVLDMGRCVDAVVEVVDLQPPGPIVLLAHSFGSHVALRAAARRPSRVGGVALVAAMGLRPHKPLRTTPFALMRWLLRGPARRLVLPVLRMAFRASGLPARDEAIAATVELLPEVDFHGMRQLLGTLRCPSFLAWSVDDPLIEPRIEEELGAALPPGPRLTLPDGGHALPSTRAVELAEALASFARSVG